MSLIYDLKLFEKELNKRISISITFFDKSVNSWQTEFIQGVLNTVDVEKCTIEIEQHFPFINFINKEETQTIFRTFKNGEFFMIECGNLKVSK
jgi:hypothetical protein